MIKVSSVAFAPHARRTEPPRALYHVQVCRLGAAFAPDAHVVRPPVALGPVHLRDTLAPVLLRAPGYVALSSTPRGHAVILPVSLSPQSIVVLK